MHAQTISRHELGMSVIQAIGNEGFDSLSAALDCLAPDFKRLLVEGAYADIIARPNLALKYRELVTVAVLATIGNADAALKYHANGMLNTGWTPEAVVETVWQTLHYAGAAVATAGIRHVAALLEARGIGIACDVKRIGQYESAIACVHQGRHAPLNALTLKERRLAVLGIVIAKENQHDAVRRHLKACLHLGWTRSELAEVLIQMTGYIGWPLVLPVTRIALDVFESADGSASATPPETEALEHDWHAWSASGGGSNMSTELVRCLDSLDAANAQPASTERGKARHLTAIACLTCLARNADVDALATHIRNVLALGASRRDIVEAIVGALPHAGALAVQSALQVANRLFEPAETPETTAT
ncbi:carboxymuconolactone decarboxylase family protein [Burkholderia territorii]|uniref:carboxymuconolactone decarboxylase family protein n=1 Tax=Burkholderia territorii TaxID=1503055 RepID=UPI000753368F|nr:carboxymuconolactone decarboxylase family protein [Burkholderia territorii]KWE36533.1 carboxymuconolactone decarboxylase [Burkholderia territorii]KWE39089.1 carboxymuconolactone decarboxylase [Burkholderia territorii]KWE53875.1 carboxymuconolactone decarboxylase [Burkholderia territorii]